MGVSEKALPSWRVRRCARLTYKSNSSITLQIKSRAGRIAVLCTLVEALIIIILESIVAAIFLRYYDVINSEGPTKGIPVYLIIFIGAQIFLIYLAADAATSVIFNACVCFYSVFQYVQMIGLVTTGDTKISASDESALRQLLLAIPIILGVFSVVFALCAYKIYLEFGWKMYKKIGADPTMRDMYRTYQIFLTFLKLDLFFALGFGVQFLVLVIQPSDPEFGITIAALPVMLAVFALAAYALKREDVWMMRAFCVGLLAAMAYFMFKLVRIYQQAAKYADTKHYLTFFACLSLAVVFCTLINAIMCYHNFGQGLKQHILITRQQSKSAGSSGFGTSRSAEVD
ncbi:hypothetical protein HDU87_004103 [Geranomyces variabilis]|uniref:Uncharacterized protein n=1 Tax=Geranomyces variabilis TaxID=109894 RepID=A0AAD5TR62_9FUNG|nr:hypothetical protein HDU87_004103 [Geranomyces variabilis]